mmetsp:Transcript_24310/g.55276  ORF Transcript_24310/g.55276 Transcript_24310/m.55276 type:complete len:202 (-) Transcript_24310:227-832(-)
MAIWMRLQMHEATASSRALACMPYLTSIFWASSDPSTAAGPLLFNSLRVSRICSTSRAFMASRSTCGTAEAMLCHRSRSCLAEATSGSSSAKLHFESAEASSSMLLLACAVRTSCRPAFHLPSRARARTRREDISISRVWRSSAERLELRRTHFTVLRYWAPWTSRSATSRSRGLLNLAEASTGAHQACTARSASELCSSC